MKLDIEISEEFKFSQIADVFENREIKVCFVCTGNTCRSPMAAAVLNQYGKQYNINAISAGLFPHVGAPISENAAEALKKHNISVPDHFAKLIDEETVKECDKIIGMSENHAFILMQMFPFAAAKIYHMPKDISDPYGGTLKVYEKCLEEIIDGVKEIFKLYD